MCGRQHWLDRWGRSGQGVRGVGTRARRSRLCQGTDRPWRTRISSRSASYNSINFGTAQSRVRLVVATPAIIRLLHEVPASVRVFVEDAFRSAGVADSKPQTRALPYAGATHHRVRAKFFDTRVCTKLVSLPPPISTFCLSPFIFNRYISILSSPLSYLSPLHPPSLGLSSHLLVAPPSRSQPPPLSPLPWSPSRHLRVLATASEVNSAARPDGFAARDPTASPRPSPPLPPHYPASFGIRRNRCARRSTHHQSPR